MSPIGVVSPAELDRERDSLEIVDLKKGRGPQNQVPTGLRKIISETAIVEGNDKAREVAEAFGISDSSVSAYKNGATSTASYSEPNEDLAGHNKEVKAKVVKKAHKTLLAALKSITPGKLVATKAREAAGIAKDMSAVIRNMEPEKETEEAGVKFVFFAPPMRKEEDYKVIDITAQGE